MSTRLAGGLNVHNSSTNAKVFNCPCLTTCRDVDTLHWKKRIACARFTISHRLVTVPSQQTALTGQNNNSLGPTFTPCRSSRVPNHRRPATAIVMQGQDTMGAQTLSSLFCNGHEKCWTPPDVPVSRPAQITPDENVAVVTVHMTTGHTYTYLLVTSTRHSNA